MNNRNIYSLRSLNLNRLIKVAQTGDNNAMGMILEKFEPMVKSITSKYYGTWAEFEDFIQVGFVGLMQAVYNFKEDSNTKFSTFAYMNISSEIKSFVTYLNRQKNKVLTDAVNLEYNDENDEGESSDYYIEKAEEENVDPLMKYLISECYLLLKDDEQIIIDYWLEGYSYKEISGLSGFKLKKVDNTVQKIKKLLGSKQEFYEKTKMFFGGAV
ncbi:MAG: sigma-70 family RNA polymerase sigma factor [Thermotogae bacterium]|nr:sigma-70 family RNA polymerase sigma factor [Thermotogota bacterium]MCP5465474.1 sigma-70 family RNA polymerase sigma factor [Thermotogota bacterium]HOO74900.1 sigma-70 family RNA polymerase sigma factor [Tepiditoga sp.]